MFPICRSLIQLGAPLAVKSFSPKRRMSGATEKRPPFNLSLYLVANRPSFPNDALFFSKILQSVKGGVSCVQLRDHESNMAATLKTAARLKRMLEEEGVPLFVNTLNLVQVAQAVDADGAYLEEPLPLSEARNLLSPKCLIGIPVKTLEEAMAPEQRNADYFSVKIACSKQTCPRNDNLWGMEGLRKICAISPHRVVAIGGLNVTCVEPVYRVLRPGDGIAMAGGLMREENPYITAQKIRAIRKQIEGGL